MKPLRVRSRPSGPVYVWSTTTMPGSSSRTSTPSCRQPRKVARGAGVGLVVGLFAGRHRQVHVDRVVRAARAELRGLLRREHVVGRRDHVVERDVLAVADASEGRDVGHGWARGGGYRRMMTGRPMTTRSKRSSTSQMCMRMQPWEA